MDSYESPAERRRAETKAKRKQFFTVMVVFLVGLVVGVNADTAVFRDRVNPPVQSGLPASLNFDSVDEVYQALRQNFDGELELDALMDGMKQGLARATGDPFTEFLNAEATQDLEEDLSGTFSGIGAELGRDGDLIIIVAPLAGFPAEAAGLRPLDAIVQIDGEIAQGLSISEAVNRIRGPVGTDVELTILRGGSERIDVTITRETITIPSVEYEIRDDGVGYLKISRFGEDTVGLATKAANEFRDAGVSQVILDMRSNPGGLLRSSVDVANLWLPRGSVILQERRGGEVIQTFTAQRSPVLEGVETVVLINQGSASASEIVAGALRDNSAAHIIGMTSFGKGSVQKLEQLRSGGTLKVTTARWHTPNGDNIDEEGIAPDQEVDRSEEDFTEERDPQLDAAVEWLRDR